MEIKILLHEPTPIYLFGCGVIENNPNFSSDCSKVNANISKKESCAKIASTVKITKSDEIVCTQLGNGGAFLLCNSLIYTYVE